MELRPAFRREHGRPHWLWGRGLRPRRTPVRPGPGAQKSHKPGHGLSPRPCPLRSSGPIGTATGQDHMDTADQRQGAAPWCGRLAGGCKPWPGPTGQPGRRLPEPGHAVGAARTCTWERPVETPAGPPPTEGRWWLKARPSPTRESSKRRQERRRLRPRTMQPLSGVGAGQAASAQSCSVHGCPAPA